MRTKKILRSLSLYLLGAGLVALLFVLAYLLVFSQITAKPEKMKQILRDSGVYRKIPAVIYDDSVDSGSTSSDSIPLKDKMVRQAALDTFTPDLVQKNIESAIDGTYGWLEGDTPQPEFKVDLKEAKDHFAASLSTQAGERLKSLPRCTAAQEEKLGRIDPLTTPCLPANVNIEALKKRVLADAAGSDNFLKDTTIDPATFKQEDGSPLFQSNSDVPQAFQTALKLPYVVGALCVMLAITLVYLNQDKSRGLKKVGRLLLVAGVCVFVAPLGISYISGALLNSSPGDKVLHDLVGPVITELNKATSRVYFTAGIGYALLAGAAFYASYRLRPSQEEANVKGKKD